MTATAPTFGQIRAQVAAVRKKVGDGVRVFGIQTVGRWAGQAVQPFGGETYHIVQCDSPLAMRVALQDDAPEVTTRVLLTSLPMEQVAADILVRLARRKFYPINNWQIVKELFQARYIDPRIAENGWIAERLLELAPTTGYAPVPSGVLDAETVWGILLRRQIGLAVTSPDLVALLKWSMDEDNIRKYRQSPEPFRVAAGEWIGQSVGPAAEVVLACVQANDRADALPVGLAMAVVFSEEAAGKLDKAAGRIEKYLGNAEVNGQIVHQWYTAATEVVRLHLPDAKVRSAWLQRADEILEAIQANDYAYLSRTSPQGFSQRLGKYGDAVLGVLGTKVSEVPEQVDEAFHKVLEHEQASWERGSRRLQRVEMSSRLLRWLVCQQQGTREISSFVESATEHALEGGFVDWARLTLRSGDPARRLADAYVSLGSKALEIREKQNRRFASLLRDWTAAGSTSNELVLLEQVLGDVVAPLAAHAPVLLLVLDGMSYAVFRELIESVTRRDWAEIRQDGRGRVLPAIAAFPSVTEVCRTSLLCGQLRHGQSSDEKAGFAEHASLLPHCRSGVPPVLFHKKALQGSDEASLAADVIKEIESTRRRIVGVVINAIDDHLLKGDQLDIHWTGEEIKSLPTLLHEAKAAGRLIVVVSDHGHVLDHQTQQCKHEGADRWRPDNGDPSENEIQIAGERVVEPANHRLIAPWSEKIRYSMKKNGYHGGVTMQEIVIPLSVLTARDDIPEGWSEPPADTPDWWFTPLEKLPVSEEQLTVQPVKPLRRKSPGLLFDMEPGEPETVSTSEPSESVTPGNIPTWLDRLFGSPVLGEQKKLGGRTLPQDDVIRELLIALNDQGGKLTSAALAHKMKLPAFRLPGLLAAIQRVLNVEGYSILTKDEASDTIELNCNLLCRQFDLT